MWLFCNNGKLLYWKCCISQLQIVTHLALVWEHEWSCVSHCSSPLSPPHLHGITGIEYANVTHTHIIGPSDCQNTTILFPLFCLYISTERKGGGLDIKCSTLASCRTVQGRRARAQAILCIEVCIDVGTQPLSSGGQHPNCPGQTQFTEK